ncbi:MAG: phage holin family protein [Fimbriimonadia bacterium]
MTNLVWRWALISVALLLTGLLGEQLKVGLNLTEQAVWKLPLAAVLIGLINALVLPLLKLITMPLHCATLGASTFVINVALFYWVGHLGLGLEVVNFWGALFGTLCVSVFSTALGFLLPDRKE